MRNRGLQGLIYSELNIFCMIISGILLYRIFTGVNKQFVSKSFAELIISAMAVFVTNTFWGLYQSGFWSPPPAAAKLTDTLYYVSLAVFSYFWFIYSETVQQSKLLWREYKIKRRLPLILLLILIALSNQCGLIFNIDGNSNESLGALYFLQVIITYGYILFTALKAVIISSKNEGFDRQEKMYLLGAFAIPTLLAGIFQIFFPSVPLVCAGITVSLLLIYIDSINRLMLVDPLTRLNNRSRLMMYLSSKIKNTADGTQLYLLIMDVDNFKTINDMYGHIEGDRALKLIARSLCLAGESRGLFVSRYGGDEFIAIYETADGVNDVKHLCGDIEDTLAAVSSEANLPYALNVSIGYTKYSKIVRNIPEFIAMADAELYKQKQNKSTKVTPF